MNPTSEDCRHARQVSEARHCASHSRCPTASLLEDRDDFIGAVGTDVLPHLLTHAQKIERALNLRDGRCSNSGRQHRDSTTKKTRRPVIDTPFVGVIALCVGVACLSGVALAAGWV